MADNFGLKIGVEGEKEFKKALSDINQSFKVLGSEMKLVESEFGKNENSVQSLTSRNEVLTKQIDAQKEKIETLSKALRNASDSFGENDRRTMAWQVQLNQAKAALNDMEHELTDNNKTLDQAGDEFNSAEKQADQFGDEIKRTADKTDDARNRLEKLGGVLKGIGVAMGTAFVAVGAAAVGAAKALTGMAVNAAKNADDILTLSTVTGMSVESLQAYKYAAELVDVPLETLTGTMAKQIRSMSSARDGSDKFAEAYKKLGVSVADSSGRLRDSDTVYWEIIDALGKVKNETERDAIAMQIFGRSAQELNPLIAQGSKGIAALTQEAKNMGAVMSKDSLDSLGKFDDSVQRLKSGINAAKNSVGTVLLPQLQMLADDGVSLLGNFTRGLNAAGGDFEKISDVIGETVSGLAGMVMKSLPKIMDVAVKIVTGLITAISENLPLIISSAGSIITSLVEGFTKALPQLTQGAVQLVLALVDGILKNLPMIVKAAIDMITTLAFGLADALPTLIPSIIEAIILIVQVLLENMDKILAAAFAIIDGLAKGLLAALPKLIDALPGIITAIIDYITSNMPLMIEMGIKLVIQLAIGLIKAIPQLVSKLPEIILAIINGLANAAGMVGEIGTDIVMGIWDGIQDMAKWLTDKISRFFGGIVDGIKGFLGIHSPSTVFAGIGGNMGRGVGAGFIAAMSDVENKMQKAIPTDFNINTTFSGLKPALASAASTVTYNHTGTIRVEGINSKNELLGVVDIVIDELRKEVRR